MIRMWGGGLALLLLCGGLALAGAPYEDTLKTTLATLDRISTTLATVKDEDSAKAAQSELRKAAADWQTLRQKMNTLPPPEPAVKARLAKDYKEKLNTSLKKLFGEVGRVQVVPGGRAALQEIAGILNKSAP